MKAIAHPNIAKLIEVIEDPQNNKLYLILEYLENGQILDWSIKTKDFKLN